MRPLPPVIIEAAINGMCSKARNPAVPKGSIEVIAEAIACLRAGASIIHVHASSFELSPEAAVAEYAAICEGVLAKVPGAHLYPTGLNAPALTDRIAHFAPLAEAGLITMGYLDPGSVNIAGETDDDGLPRGGIAYVNTFDECRQAFALFEQLRLGPSLAVYEPGFLRLILAYATAGRLPPGAFVKFYFGGAYSPFTGHKAVTHGLPPTPPSLDALLAMHADTPLPWGVGAFGGDIGQSSVLPYALERGGHVRLGLEDFGGTRTPRNTELIAEVATLAAHFGRNPATPEETAEILMLPTRRGG